MTIKTIADKDPWLEPYRSKLEQQQAYIAQAKRRILGDKKPDDFALGHLYFGLHKADNGWLLREWAPNAKAIFLLSELNNWEDDEDYEFKHGEHGVWELALAPHRLKHGDHYKLHVHWDGGSGERIPAYANYVKQDSETNVFDAVVWQPVEQFEWKSAVPQPANVPLIYEAHVGMSSDEPEVASYRHFTENILPRIKDLGYNTVQLLSLIHI